MCCLCFEDGVCFKVIQLCVVLLLFRKGLSQQVASFYGFGMNQSLISLQMISYYSLMI